MQPTSLTLLAQYIEKMLLYRSRRDVRSRVFAPAAGGRNYSVILETSEHREQINLDARQIEQFAKTGADQYIVSEIRAALRSLDKRVLKRNSSDRP
ncbi:MAG: hypothetical protein A3F68_07320 [Acidobacteria bacterium RIFCSPLOWO2_12_FULL_54_10]|nr:MAG: hypothetical protein A3F68_07320 [Acidobacteria bacterium RIFCSPLOWO2_12_FULL_54_10]